MGNLLNRKTGIICADTNDEAVRATLCAPDLAFDEAHWFEVGNTPVNCTHCLAEINGVKDEAHDSNDEANEGATFGMLLSDLLDALVGGEKQDEKATGGRHRTPEEPTGSSLGDLLDTLLGGERAKAAGITSACMDGTCDHPKIGDASDIPSFAEAQEIASGFSDEAKIVAVTIFRATTGWQMGAVETDDDELNVGVAAALSLAGLIAEALYPDDKVKQEHFTRICRPNPMMALLLDMTN